MIVHFSASLGTLEENIDNYKKILSVLREQDCSVANDWVEAAWNGSADKYSQDWRAASSRGVAGLEMADLAIMEGTGFSSFGVGYEAGYAIKIRKPTLILIKKEYMEKSYAIGLESDLVSVKAYTADNLVAIVKKFLKEYRQTAKDLRFNFVIDRKIYHHLRRKSAQTGKTKAEILRDLLIKDIER